MTTSVTKTEKTSAARPARGPLPGTGSPRQALATAQEVWGAELPEWVERLASASDQTSQGQVAKRLRYSAGVVSQVINRTYKGSMTAIEKAVRGELLAETVDCPVIGEMQLNICLKHQKCAGGNFNPTSSARVALYRACKGGCVHSRFKQEFNHGE